MADEQSDFEKKLTKETEEGFKARVDDAPPIGMQPDGTIKLLAPGEEDDFDPEVVTGEEDEDLDPEFEDVDVGGEEDDDFSDIRQMVEDDE